MRSISTGPAKSDKGLRDGLEKVQVTLGDLCFNSAGLAIGSSSKKAVKIANTVYTIHNGVIAKKTTAEVALPAVTVTNAKFNVFLVSIDSAGTVTISGGTEGASLATVVLPAVPAGNASLGFVIVNPTGTGNFVGATTELDDATVAPNAVYTNTPYPFNQAEQAL